MNDEDVLMSYFGARLNKVIKSPVRKDNKPSFCFYKTKGGYIAYKDFATGENGFMYDLIAKLENTTTEQVKSKYNVSAHFFYNKPNNNTKIKPYFIKFTKAGIDYWKQYNIGYNLIKMANISQISYVSVGDYTKKCEEIAFAYKKHDEYKFKIYQPYSKTDKWKNNVSGSYVWLYNSLPKNGENVVITSSVKDALCIMANLNMYSICGNSEMWTPTEKLIDDLKSRFKNVFVWFDNDKVGLDQSKKISNNFNIPYILTPKFAGKDPSDCYQKFKNIYYGIYKTN